MNTNEVATNPLSTEPINKLLAKFAIPCVVSLIVNSLYNIVDQIFIGRGVGYLGNGATNVVFPITIIALALALLIGDGAAAYLSVKMGENKKEDAEYGVGNAITLSAIIGILLFILCIIFLEPLLYVFGCTELIMPYAKSYGGIILVGLPFVIGGTALNSIIRADGSPAYAMKSMLLGALINTVLDPVFIFIFDMGVGGAAIATIIGQIASFAVSIAYLRKFKSIKLTKEHYKLKFNYCKAVASFGISSFITQIAIVAVMATTNNLLTKYGALSIYGAEIPLTAMGVVMKVNQIMISIIVGIAAGAQPIIGFNYGAGLTDRVKKTLNLTIIYATIVTVISFIGFRFFTMSIINLFGSEEQLYNEFAVKCFHIFLSTCILNGFQTISSIFMQSIGKPIKAGVLSLSRQIIFLIPSALIVSSIVGVEGVLWAGPIADTLAFILALIVMFVEMRSYDKKNIPALAI